MEARCAFVPDYDAPACIRARQAALEHLMDTLPAPSVEGLRARLAWLAHLNAREMTRDAKADAALIATLRADFEAVAGGVQSGRRSTADKAAEVRALLRAEPGLSDREIARRVRVSPQTVGNWRRRAA